MRAKQATLKRRIAEIDKRLDVESPQFGPLLSQQPVSRAQIRSVLKPREALTRFYRDWYRPDLMAVIVVGDVDRDAAVAMIAMHDGGIPAIVSGPIFASTWRTESASTQPGQAAWPEQSMGSSWMSRLSM